MNRGPQGLIPQDPTACLASSTTGARSRPRGVVLIAPAWHLLLVNVPPMSIAASIHSIDKRRMGQALERSCPVAP